MKHLIKIYLKLVHIKILLIKLKFLDANVFYLIEKLNNLCNNIFDEKKLHESKDLPI